MNAKAVMEAVKEMPGCQLIIKLHPRDEYTQSYQRMKNELKIKPIISKELNIYKALYVCDVMITKFSTTAIEAAVLGKPVIVLNLTSKFDPAGYVKSGIALGVYKKENLSNTLRLALHDKKTKEKIGKKRPNFIRDYAYKIDGKSSERVLKMFSEVGENA